MGNDKGATFTLTLPLVSARAETPLAATTETQAGGGGLAEVPSSLAGVRVLVVEDKSDMLEMLTAWLKQRGAETKGATSAQEAFDLFLTWQPQVLLSDIALPIEDGCSLIQRVRALGPERGGDVPAAALSAYTREQDRQRALEAGFQIYIPKPVDPAELGLIIASLAERNRKAQSV